MVSQLNETRAWAHTLRRCSQYIFHLVFFFIVALLYKTLQSLSQSSLIFAIGLMRWSVLRHFYQTSGHLREAGIFYGWDVIKVITRCDCEVKIYVNEDQTNVLMDLWTQLAFSTSLKKCLHLVESSTTCDWRLAMNAVSHMGWTQLQWNIF